MKKPSATLSLIQRYPALFAWVCIYIIFILSSSAHQNIKVAFLLANTTIVPMIVLWASTRYYLAPKVLHKNTGMFFGGCVILLLVVSTLASESDLLISSKLYHSGQLHFPPEVEAAIKRGDSQRHYLHAKYSILLLTTMAVTTISWMLDERKQQNLLQREHRTQLELKYLRAQINPHFLFNALNCIYSLTMTQDSKAPDSVLKLSEMLRYVSDDCRSDRVPLHREISYIRNYIDFQKIRMEEEADVQFDCQVADPNCKIPPMLFQPMVENCFKHSGIINHQDAYIHILLRQDEKQLLFVAENSIPPAELKTLNKERTGIGLSNVQQRLQLLFKDKADIKSTQTDNNYRIELCIKF